MIALNRITMHCWYKVGVYCIVMQCVVCGLMARQCGELCCSIWC